MISQRSFAPLYDTRTETVGFIGGGGEGERKGKEEGGKERERRVRLFAGMTAAAMVVVAVGAVLLLLVLLLVVLLVVVDMSCLRRWVKMAKDSIVLKVMMYLNWWRRHVVVTSSTMVNTLNVVVHVFVGISIANIETKNTFTT